MILIARPRPIISGSLWVIRGSSWYDFVLSYRSSLRYGNEPLPSSCDLGFRVILKKKVS